MSTHTQIDKQELIDWISGLDDQEILQRIKIFKEHSESVSWNDLPDVVKEGIRRGEEDIKAGRVYSSKEFWRNIRKWREERDV